MVERSTGKKVKTLRLDNGANIPLWNSKTILRKEGIIHQLTVPKCPEQNGFTEWINRTLIE